MTDKIMKYLQDTFNCEFNHFTYNTFENMIDYAVNNFNHSKNQLAYYLSSIIDELEFEEIKKIIEENEENKRTCSECGKEMTQGHCIENGMEYYCSDECLHKNMTQEEYLELYDDGNGDSYWTEWED